MHEDLLARIRNGQPLSFSEKIRLVISLSMPSIMAQLTSIIMQYIDAAMVGRLGANASAAIGVVASSTWLFSGLCVAVVAGFSIQVAHYIGAKEFDRAKDVLRHSYLVVAVLAVLVAIVGTSVSGKLPIWLGSDVDIRKDASRYFMVFALSLPAVALNRLAATMLQCSGNMKIPGILNSLMCGWDVLLNLVFIYGFGMGVTGAAIGTALSEVITAVCMLYFLNEKTEMLKIDRSVKFRLQPYYLRKAAMLSFPIACERFIMSGALVMTTSMVAPLGAIATASNSLAVTAESLCYMPGFGIGEAATTLIGQSVGAGRKDMAKSFSRMTVVFAMSFMAATAVLLYIFAPFLMGMLSNDPEVCELGVKILRIEAFAEPLYGASIVVAGVLRGAGDTAMCSILSLVSLWCVRVPFSYLLVKPLGLIGIWCAMCGELCFRGLIFLVRMIRGRWLDKAV